MAIQAYNCTENQSVNELQLVNQEVFMASILSDEQLFDIVREALVLALAVEPEEVAPEKTLVGDLGAESIDFLDITFRLEQCLPIKIPRDDIIEQAQDVFGEDTTVDAERCLTPLGAYLITNRLRGIDDSRVVPGLKIEEVAGLWTVQSWIDLSNRLLNTIPERCPQCGGERIISQEENFYQVRCTRCTLPIPSTPGDVLNQQWFEEVKTTPEVQELIAASRAFVALRGQGDGAAAEHSQEDDKVSVRSQRDSIN
jgi:acyl carrier protein